MPQHNSKACKIAVRTLSAASIPLLAGNFLFEAPPLIVGGAAILAGYGMFKLTKASIIKSEAKIKPPGLNK
jgi:hypothetical protein